MIRALQLTPRALQAGRKSQSWKGNVTQCAGLHGKHGTDATGQDENWTEHAFRLHVCYVGTQVGIGDRA
jgi:hypothetical protein